MFYRCFLRPRALDYSLVDACWLTLAFCFGTSFIGVIYLSWSFSHGLTVLCLFLAIAEYENKRRLLLIGLLIGLAMTSHAPAGLNIIFFVLVALLGAGRITDKSTDLAKLLLPFIFIVGSLAFYNFARFGSPLESGYSYQINRFGLPYAGWNVPGNIAGPAVSLANLPTNLWTFLFGLPEAAAIGSSVFLLSPFAVYLATLRRSDITNTLIVVNVVLVLAAVLAFRSTGFEQVGYRFSLDFLPFIFWLAVRSRLRVTPELRALIFFATLIDLGLVCYFHATRI